MPIQHVLIWVVAGASIFCMLIRPRGIPEAWWVCSGALLLLLLRAVSPKLAMTAVFKGWDVYLFLTGMMVLAELAQQTGVFDWIAGIASRRAKGSSTRLFLLIYLAGIVVTALLSNDATAVVLTPAVLAVVRKAEVPPKPYLLSCALIANAASFLLPISNPANLVIFAHNLPRLGDWLGRFLLPSVAAITITYLCLRLLSSRELRGSGVNQLIVMNLEEDGRFAAYGLLLACFVLILSSALGWRLGPPTCASAAVVLSLVSWKRRGIAPKVLERVSWAVLPLVAGLFILVEAMNTTGLLRLAVSGLNACARMPALPGTATVAFGVGLLSNVANNLPVGLMSGAALTAAHQTGSLANAVLIGVDLGPNLSVTGSLATILWLIALRREEVKITAWEFSKTGGIAMLLALAGSVLLLR